MNFIRTFLSGSFVVFSLLVFATASFSLSYLKEVSKTLPDVSTVGDWKPREGSTILGADGTVMGVHAKEFREYVPLQNIPPIVVAAFLSAEDSNYWNHKGVDPIAVIRALLINLKGVDRMVGGSTITQQVVKNLLLTPERTLDRKIKEALLALKVDQEIGKARVLDIYLNEIYLGSGAYGVQAASKRYFNKPVEQLTPAEAAVLAGLPQAPSAANPFSNLQKATERRNYVLERMAKNGYLTVDEATSYQNTPLLTVKSDESPTGVADPAYSYAENAVRLLQVEAVGKADFYSHGGEIKTSLVPHLQKVVHGELRHGLVMEDRLHGYRGPVARGIKAPVNWDDQALALPSGSEDWSLGVVSTVGKDIILETKSGSVSIPKRGFSWALGGRGASTVFAPGDALLFTDFGDGPEVVQIPKTQGAVVVMRPQTGAVLALDGGFSFETSQFNRATQAQRQIGSLFKPFIYLTALKLGYTAMSPVLDRPIALDNGDGNGDWRPQADDKGLGLITFRQALERSRNLATVRLLYDIGEDQIGDVARFMGLNLPDKMSYAMALGAAATTPLNVAATYSAIANGGHPVTANFKSDAPIYSDQAPSFDPISIAQLASIMEGVTYAGTARSAFQGFEHPIAGKTGTTNDSRDVWFAGFGPDYVVVAWIGNDDYSPLHRGSAGGETVAPMVRRILDRSNGSIAFNSFYLPDGAVTVRVDRSTGAVDPEGDVDEIVRSEDQAQYSSPSQKSGGSDQNTQSETDPSTASQPVETPPDQ